jgi:hypothetical protein
LSSHPVDVGQRTEAIVLAALVGRGHRVSDRVYALDVDEAASSEGVGADAELPA